LTTATAIMPAGGFADDQRARRSELAVGGIMMPPATPAHGTCCVAYGGDTRKSGHCPP